VTTILASMKHRVMVADSHVSGGTSFKTTKIHRVGDKLVGFSGTLSHCLKFLEWLKHGTPLNLVYDKEEHTFCALVMDGGFLYYYDNELIATAVDDQIYAIGSGAEYALGAIDAGATPKRAVEIACKRDDGSKGPVVLMKHKL
jgi:ATP-dependent protease HslVU (ClpYQ) peptidase subunit